MPTLEQARKVVAEMEALPAYEGVFGCRIRPYRDFEALRYPVYLPILAEKAAKSSLEAITGIGSIPTPNATRVLLRLLENKAPAVVKAVATALNDRLPDPELTGRVKPRYAFRLDEAPHRWLTQQSWRAELTRALEILDVQIE